MPQSCNILIFIKLLLKISFFFAKWIKLLVPLKISSRNCRASKISKFKIIKKVSSKNNEICSKLIKINTITKCFPVRWWKKIIKLKQKKIEFGAKNIFVPRLCLNHEDCMPFLILYWNVMILIICRVFKLKVTKNCSI